MHKHTYDSDRVADTHTIDSDRVADTHTLLKVKCRVRTHGHTHTPMKSSFFASVPNAPPSIGLCTCPLSGLTYLIDPTCDQRSRRERRQAEGDLIAHSHSSVTISILHCIVIASGYGCQDTLSPFLVV